MLRALHSSLPVVTALVTLFSTGCAGKLRASGSFSARPPTLAVQTSASAQASGAASGQFQGAAVTPSQAQPSCAPSSAPPPPSAQVAYRPVPVFYGVPLANAQDVVFVLDRSGSMSEPAETTASFATPAVTLSTLTTFGSRVAGAVLTATPKTVTPTPTATPFVPFAQFTAQPTKLEAAKAELTSTLAALPDGTRFNIIFFEDNVSALSTSLVSLTPVSRLTTIAFLQSVRPGGTTAAVPALRTAYASRPRRVVFLSDGLANTGGDGRTLLAEARVEMRRGVRFDTVGVGRDQDKSLMKALAVESGGVADTR